MSHSEEGKHEWFSLVSATWEAVSFNKFCLLFISISSCVYVWIWNSICYQKPIDLTLRSLSLLIILNHSCVIHSSDPCFHHHPLDYKHEIALYKMFYLFNFDVSLRLFPLTPTHTTCSQEHRTGYELTCICTNLRRYPGFDSLPPRTLYKFSQHLCIEELVPDVTCK